MKKRTILLPAALVLAQLGCGQGGGTAAKSTGSTTPPVTSNNLVVTAFTPASAPAASTPSLQIVFSKALDPATLVDGTTYMAVEDDDTTPAGTFHVLPG